MLKSIALRRVLIYFGLSSAGVAAVSQLELDQRSAGVIYVPMFVGIYVLSRWIESKLSATPPSLSPEADSALPSKGFMAKSPKP